MSVWQSSLLSSHFFCFSCLSLSAWAAESAHQINTERGIVFRLETAEQVTDNGNTWKCVNRGCKKKAIPMQISAGASLKSNLILEFNNSSKLFSRGKKTLDSFEKISIQAKAFLTHQRRKNTHYETHPWSTKCYHHKTSTGGGQERRHWRRHGDMVDFHGLQCLSHSA